MEFYANGFAKIGFNNIDYNLLPLAAAKDGHDDVYIKLYINYKHS